MSQAITSGMLTVFFFFFPIFLSGNFYLQLPFFRMAESLILVQGKLNLQDFSSSTECFPLLPSTQGHCQAPRGIGEITAWVGVERLPGAFGLLAVSAPPDLLPTTQENTQLPAGVLSCPSPSHPTPESEAKFSLLPVPSSPPGHRLPFSETHMEV